MKLFASMLMLLILLHCACMGRCLAEESSKQPPCHQQKDNPKQDSNLCSEGPALEAKGAPVVKCTLDVVDLPSLAPTLAFAPAPAWQPDSVPHSEIASPPLLRLTVLRI